VRRLETASGSIECAPDFLLAELDRLRRTPAAPPAPGQLSLIGRRHVRSNNSWMHNAPRLVKGKPRHQLHVHPSDLASRGLADGDLARVRSRTGVVEVEVCASDALLPGVVCLPHGFGHGRAGSRMTRASAVTGASYNDLTDPLRIDGPSGNAALNGTPVSLERLSG
jgi:anaerobic selenocysteine-containing dehydrogenase